MTAHCSVVTSMPVSALMAGRRMLTAEVLAFTTKVDRQVAASTPPARAAVSAAACPELPDPADELVPVMVALPPPRTRASRAPRI